MNNYITKLIQQGEHQTPDFKYCISNSRTIARSTKIPDRQEWKKGEIGDRKRKIGKSGGILRQKNN